MKRFFILKIHKIWLISAVVFSTVGCDQVTKMAARDTLKYIGAVSYLGNTFRMEYAENAGAFMSLGQELSHSIRFLIFSVLVFIFLGLLAIQLVRSKMSLIKTMGYSLILGGGIGNLIDRVLHGQVVDFLNIGFGSLRTGIFNIADVAVTAGVVVLLLEPYIIRRRFWSNQRG